MRVVSITSAEIESNPRGIRADISPPSDEVEASVREIVEGVKNGGDDALFRYTKRFDNCDIDASSVRVSDEEMERASGLVSDRIKEDLIAAAERVRVYHEKKLPTDYTFRDSLGNELGWLVRPVERVGIYVPGGKAAYPSTVLMTVIPALVAGVERISLVTPTPDGELNPAVLVAAGIAGGATSIYKIGGAQAVAALAYGTESVPGVDKIVGPGNVYVALAKKYVYGVVDIDMIAGPSEVLVIADGSCPASWVASDLLAQAEHDELAVPIMVTTSDEYAREVSTEVGRRLAGLERREIAEVAINNQGRIFVVESLQNAAALANAIAPEHLEICTESPESMLPLIRNAGAVFLGTLSTEAFGDYVAGPSHVLPTGGAARFSSPLSVFDFIKMPSTISFSRKGFDALSDAVMNLAYSEGLEAHALSVKVRSDRT